MVTSREPFGDVDNLREWGLVHMGDRNRMLQWRGGLPAQSIGSHTGVWMGEVCGGVCRLADGDGRLLVEDEP
jgi:hypothetical protein